jgi:hypothetical protein
MGQALDEHGNVLGEAFGQTKREVFDKLQAAHANAHELRIRSLMGKIEGESRPMSLSERVAELERIAEESKAARNAKEDLETIAATLLLNFGDTPQNKAGFIIQKDTPLLMLLQVLEKLTKKEPII